MPIYEFECASCGNRFERVMKVNEENPPCPSCGTSKVKKLVTPFRTNAWSSFLDGMEKKVSPEKFK
jgi:putative FmdB family regulatory protein